MKKVIKLYLRQHAEIIFAVIFSCIGISGSLSVLEQNSDFLYLGILYLFLFFILMGVNFYKNIPLYSSILSEISSEMDFIILGNSPLARAQREHMKKIRRIYLEATGNLENENKNYRMLINKWIHQMKTLLSVLNMLSQEEKGKTSEILASEIEK